MSSERIVRLLPSGDGQTVHIPREFALPGDQAMMRKEGERLIIELAPDRKTQDFLEWLAAQEPIDYEFDIPDLPLDPSPDLS